MRVRAILRGSFSSHTNPPQPQLRPSPSLAASPPLDFAITLEVISTSTMDAFTTLTIIFNLALPAAAGAKEDADKGLEVADFEHQGGQGQYAYCTVA